MTKQDLRAAVVGKLIEMLKENDAVDHQLLSVDASFDEMGFDSITLVELAIQIETAYQLKLSAEELVNCQSINGIAGALAEKLTFEHVH